MRGGGGNFGIVTEFEFRLHPVGPTVLAGPIFRPMEKAPALLRYYRKWSAEAPDELMTILVQRRMPAVDFVPAELHGKLVLAVACCYTDPVEEERHMRLLKAFGSPVLDLCEPKPYVAHQAMFDASFPHGWWYYFRACDVGELSEEVIDVMAEYGRRIVSLVTSVAPVADGRGSRARGRVRRPPSTAATPVSASTSTATAKPPTEFEAERGGYAPTGPRRSPTHTSVYVNFLMEVSPERIRQAYGTEKHERLKTLKRTYDPGNVFRLNQNILLWTARLIAGQQASLEQRQSRPDLPTRRRGGRVRTWSQ